MSLWPPLLNFELCLNRSKEHNWYGSVVKINRLMKKTVHNFLTFTCVPTFKMVPPPLSIMHHFVFD